MEKWLLALGSGAVGVSVGIVITLMTIDSLRWTEDRAKRRERILREREERRG